MSIVRPCALPAAALLHDSVAQGAYADCFCIDVPLPVSHAAFVEAFYTTSVFRVERWILRWALSRPSTDADARRRAGAGCSAPCSGSTPCIRVSCCPRRDPACWPCSGVDARLPQRATAAS